MKKYNYFGRVSGWGICMLFLLTGLFTGCSENEEDYPKGQRPAGIESVRKVACIGNSITYAFLPNIVIVKLGSNDSKSGNWSSHGSEFESDLTDLVLSLRSLSTRPRVFLCTPAIAYSNSFGIDDGIITSEIIPAIQRVAEAQNLTVIDLHTALRGYGDLFLDGVHPGLEGNRVIATIIYDVLAKEYSLNK